MYALWKRGFAAARSNAGGNFQRHGAQYLGKAASFRIVGKQ
jgi:hypothetical protein